MESKQLKWIYLVGLALLIWGFIYFKVDWIISSTGWFLTVIFAAVFYY
jgi:hypothetical protein